MAHLAHPEATRRERTGAQAGARRPLTKKKEVVEFFNTQVEN
jgi:hypothetical protein